MTQETIRWRPGSNALTHERPFEPRSIRPLEGAVYSALLGPAMLLPPHLLPWLLFLLLLQLNALAFSALPGRHRLGSVSGTRTLLAMLFLLPLEAGYSLDLLAYAGLGEVMQPLELALLLVSHLSALLFFQGRARLPERERRRWSVQAVFWLPAAYGVLFLAGLFEHALLLLPLDDVASGARAFLASGLPRLLIVVLVLGFFQLRRRRMDAGRSSAVEDQA